MSAKNQVLSVQILYNVESEKETKASGLSWADGSRGEGDSSWDCYITIYKFGANLERQQSVITASASENGLCEFGVSLVWVWPLRDESLHRALVIVRPPPRPIYFALDFLYGIYECTCKVSE